ncbi:hypothetical protein MK805_02625 [Shimazuella sp. AN120528]|uniref:hypothetical protein n=1 Tax=Shimazuella soli TaxID=1892854 RepID=UPI001F0F2A5E|nr:hypothetical protein [Shimazuella soli]MCH5583862.1 hypothetical protein [Shimazuella soli]
MVAILELIKTLIPFGIAFLILWGIGRLCCTKSSKQPVGEQKKQKKSKQKNKNKKPSTDPNQGFAQKESMMDNKSDFFSSKKSMIPSDREHAELNTVLPLPMAKQKKLRPLQKAFLLKEILDSPKAIKPYKRKYPR